MFSTTWFSTTIIFLSIKIITAAGTKRIVYENAGVESGRTIFNMCFLTQLNTSSAYTGFRPVLGRAGGKIGYIALYSCQGPDAGNFVSLKDRALSCDNRDMALVLDSCGHRLMFIWSRAMGQDHEETLPSDIVGVRPDRSGLALMVVSYIDMLIQDQDSSGLELTELDGDGLGDKEEVGRLVISHNLPRLVVMAGAETWRTYAVCHRSCLRRLDEAELIVR